MKAFVESHVLAGAVILVASQDKVLSMEAIGYSDLAAQKPMQTDAVFWIASESKAMTAAALMMLVDEGKLSVDDPVEKYLPEFKEQWLAVEKDKDHILLKKPAHPVTIRQLLSHTSGLPFGSAAEAPTLDQLPLCAAVRTYAMTPLDHEPGTNYCYSNAGINTAGRLIEVVSGMPYEQFMAKRLFEPLGMKDTTFWPTEEQVGRLAKSYKVNASKTGLQETPITLLHYPLSDRSRGPMPAGGLFSTAADVVRFGQMLLGNGSFQGKRYLSESSVRQMTSNQTGDSLSQKYGFGLHVFDDGSFGHGGAYKTQMFVFPKEQLVAILMVQNAGFPNPDIEKKVIHTFKNAAQKSFAHQP
jgi:CubicO group peptidase (beta-lactamase class C family)